MQLQSDILALTNWCRDNKLSLNGEKCRVISFSRKKEPIVYTYLLDGDILARETLIRDLGVIFDAELRFVHHYDNVIARAFKMTGFVMRQCWDFDNVETLKSVYFALVRSLLEYCSIVWSPFYKTHIDRIERVQSRFVNFLLYKININPHMLAYPEWLRLIGLESLESRHNHLSLSFGHKILNNSVNSPELLGLINFRVPSRPTRQQELFSLNHSRTDIGKNNPINRMMRLFNELPFDFDLNCSLNSFKNKLKKLYIWLIHASFRTLFTFFFLCYD